MSYPIYMVPAGDVLPVMFSSYAGSTGASVTLSGLAVTDIEIYKDGSTTQRSSDAGYTLLDTDGIDFDGVTGIHGFSIDTGDNTDSGFYTVGAWFHVVVSAVTIDTQTVSFIACAFRLMAAESVAATPKVDASALGGSAQSATDLKDFADAGYDPSTHKVQGVVLTDTITTYTGNTPQTGDTYALANGASGFVAMKADTAATLADTNELQTDWADGGRLDLILDARASQTSVDDLPTNSELATALAAADDAVLAAIAALNNLGSAGAQAAAEAALAAYGASTFDPSADAVEGSVTYQQSMRLLNSAAGGKASGLETTNAKYRDLADSKDRIDATVDVDGNRTAVTLDLT